MIAKVLFVVQYGFFNDFLNCILSNNIPLYSVKNTEFGFAAVCYAWDYKKIAKLSRSFQCRIHIKEKHGLYFKLHKYRKRKGIMAAVVIFPVICVFLSCIIWRIDIKTDDIQLKNVIGHSLYSQGIYAGSLCTKEKLADVQRQLMLENRNLGYVTLNFYRGVLECHVYIRNEKDNNKEEYSENDILCRLAGVITDIRVYSGFSCVRKGQSVAVGDKMVSASRTDSKGRVDVQDTAAYIAGDCEKEYKVYIPYLKAVEIYTGNQKRDTTICFLGIEYPLVKNKLTDFGSYTSETIITPANFFGFSFPFTIKTDVYTQTGEKQIAYDFPSARKAGQNQLAHMVENDIKLENEYSREYDYILSDEGLTVICRVKGRYVMT